MSWMGKMLLTLLTSPCFMVAIHAAANRLHVASQRQIAAVLSTALAHIPVGILLWILVFPDVQRGERWAVILYSVIVYECLAGIYFIFFMMSETARRVHLLNLAFEGHNVNDLQDQYGAIYQVRVRLDRLLGMGQLEFQDDRYRIRRKFLLSIARGIRAWSSLLGMSW